MLEVDAAAQPLHDHLREVEGRVLTHQLAGAHHPVVVDHLGLHGRAGGVVLKPNNHDVSQSVSNNTSTTYCCCNSWLSWGVGGGGDPASKATKRSASLTTHPSLVAQPNNTSITETGVSTES